MSDRERMLKQVQEYKFAAYDMLLYLDTHPDDTSAFELYKSLVKKLRTLMAEFEKRFGPLSAFAAADQERFNWLDNPWPWDKQSSAASPAPRSSSDSADGGCCEKSSGGW